MLPTEIKEDLSIIKKRFDSLAFEVNLLKETEKQISFSVTAPVCYIKNKNNKKEVIENQIVCIIVWYRKGKYWDVSHSMFGLNTFRTFLSLIGVRTN